MENAKTIGLDVLPEKPDHRRQQKLPDGNMQAEKQAGAQPRLSANVCIALLLILLGAALRAAYCYEVVHSPLSLNHSINTTYGNYLLAEWSTQILNGDLLDLGTYHPRFNWMHAFGDALFWDRVWGNAAVFHQAPLYTYLLALLRHLWGGDYALLYAVQLAMDLLAMCLVGRIAALIFGPSIGLIALGMGVLLAPNLFYAGQVGREAWIFFAHALSLWWLVRPQKPLGLVVGIWSGLCVLLSPLLFFNGILLGWRLRRDRQSLLLAVFGVVLVFSPIMLRNAVVGAPILSFDASLKEAIVLAQHYNASPSLPSNHPEDFASLVDGTGNVFEAWWRCVQAGGFGNYMNLLYSKAISPFYPDSLQDQLSELFARDYSLTLNLLFGYNALLLCALFGLGVFCIHPYCRAVLPKDEQKARIAVRWSLVALAMLLVTPMYARHRQPLVIPLAIWAAFGLVELRKRIQQRMWCSSVVVQLGFSVFMAALPFLLGLPYPRSDARDYLRTADTLARQSHYQQLDEPIRLTRLLLKHAENGEFNGLVMEEARLQLAGYLAANKSIAEATLLLTGYPWREINLERAYALLADILRSSPGRKAESHLFLRLASDVQQRQNRIKQ